MAKQVTSGEKFRFSARVYNDMNRLIETNQMAQLSTRSQKHPSGSEFVYVKNNSGINVSRFGVLGISGILFDPQTALPAFTSNVVFTGVKPQETHDSKFLICAEPVRAGAIGRAWADGIVTTKIQILDVAHTCATILADDVSQLKSAETGLCYILWKESGTGTKWAVVRFGGGGSVIGSRWAFYKAFKDSLTCTAYLDKNTTGKVVDVRFILTGGCANHTQGHITVAVGLQMPVMLKDSVWYCMYPLQGVQVCEPVE